MKSKLLIIALTSLTSFCLAAENKNAKEGDMDSAERAKNLIKKHDKDGDGTINKNELAKSKVGKKISEKHGAEAFDKFFSRIDKNGDGELNKPELTKMKDKLKKAAKKKRGTQ